MSNRFATICAVGTLAVAAASRAETVALWRHNPITPQAIASDPALAGMQSWSLIGTHATGFWASAGLRAALAPGLTFYNTSPSRGGSETRPRPASVTMFPDLEFDTYVSAPFNQLGSNPPAILGPFPENQYPVSFGGPTDPLPGMFSASWGDPFGIQHSPGTYEYVRLTFPVSVLPEVLPQSVVWFVAPDQMALIPTTIPEPAAVAFALLLIVTPRLRQRARIASREVA
jgi:hypothetical protein